MTNLDEKIISILGNKGKDDYVKLQFIRQEFVRNGWIGPEEIEERARRLKKAIHPDDTYYRTENIFAEGYNKALDDMGEIQPFNHKSNSDGSVDLEYKSGEYKIRLILLQNFNRPDITSRMNQSVHKATEAINQLIYTQVLELIGEDESKYKEVNIYNGYQKDIVGVGKEPNKSAIIRNRFRAKLRNEAKAKYIGGDSE